MQTENVKERRKTSSEILKSKMEIEASSNRKTLKSSETTRYPERKVKYLEYIEFCNIPKKKFSELKSMPGKNVVVKNQTIKGKEKKLRA
ncbi:hypothetical protein CDAR_601681 [Caerostris darwini]|uniref:Uncharacterized protein n=1 Tax=Caerostris darwini TaxID=1538125 RepID=A0AAV4MZ62_9ARAC|nr:hypothetical protein CDAR_601681 [Caerostris darwini]